MRDHEPITIEEFNGWWRRGDKEAAPMDHAVDLNNVQFFESGVRTRDGIEVMQIGDEVGATYPDVVRMYTFVHNGVQGLLVLDSLGNIYHSRSPTPFVAILTIPEMTDFAFVGIAGRAYISPHDGVMGLEDEFLYVYLGNGSPARKAGGAAPVGAAMTVTPNGVGNIEAGVHIWGVVYETDTGFLTQLGPTTFTDQTFDGNNAADISGIPISPSSDVVARRIVVTKAINPVDYLGDLDAYQFFFVPNGRIPNNSATTLNGVNFFDVELLEDASHLLDLFAEIPAGVFLTTYHERLVIGGFFADLTSTDQAIIALPSTAYVSFKGEPEAIDQVDGIIVTPLEGNPLTNGQEFRDVLYLFKKTRTYAYNDNGDTPVTWLLAVIDQGIGCSVHGIASVLDSGGVNIEYLIVIDFSGVMLFNGTYIRPELSWKIADYWLGLDRDTFNQFQVANDSLNQRIYITQGNTTILYAEYADNLDPKSIKWAPWTFTVPEITSLTLINTDTLVIGASLAAIP